MAEFNAIGAFLREYGWMGAAILIVGAWLGGVLHSDREQKQVIASYEQRLIERDKRFDDMKSDRDEWRDKAGVAIRGLEQLTDVMQPAQNPKRGR